MDALKIDGDGQKDVESRPVAASRREFWLVAVGIWPRGFLTNLTEFSSSFNGI